MSPLSILMVGPQRDTTVEGVDGIEPLIRLYGENIACITGAYSDNFTKKGVAKTIGKSSMCNDGNNGKVQICWETDN